MSSQNQPKKEQISKGANWPVIIGHLFAFLSIAYGFLMNKSAETILQQQYITLEQIKYILLAIFWELVAIFNKE